MTTTRTAIMQGLASRLATVTAAAGYTTDVKKVYNDDIPLGSSLNDYQLPAILLIEAGDNPAMDFKQFKGEWTVSLQLWSGQAVDSAMHQFVADVFKAIYANSPVAQDEGAFRSIHPKLVEIIPARIAPDLNMIEGNRVYEVSFVIRYRTELWNL